MLKVIRATMKSMPQFQGPIILETLDMSQICKPNLKKQKCYPNKRIVFGAYSGIKIFHATVSLMTQCVAKSLGTPFPCHQGLRR